MNKLIAVLLLCIFPLAVTAEEKPIIKPLLKGQKAPFNGVLFNDLAVAQSIADKEYSGEQCRLYSKYIEDREKAKCDLFIKNIQADFDALEKKYNSVVEIKSQEIERLQEIALSKPNSNSHWWFVGGILSGVIITIGVTYANK